MKFQWCILAVFVITFFSNCGQGYTVSDNSTDTVKHSSKIEHKILTEKRDTSKKDKLKDLDLKYGFKIKASRGEDFGDFKTYHSLELWHNGLKIFTDTTVEYEFDEKLYPILNELAPSVFELLIEFNDRPNKDKLTFLRIENNRIAKKELLPTFDGKPEIVNSTLEYSGQWDNGEDWDENGKRYTAYDPIIYYKFTSDGIKLDSALTVLRNREEYGRFNGFNYNGNIGYPIDD